MAIVERHPVGDFCWFELATSDQNAAKSFYSQLFGWTIEDTPMGPQGVYTRFQIDGKDVGAACTLMPPQVEQGIPPHWMMYVAVDNADETAAKAPAAGGKVIMPPFDVFDLGRMSVLQDPSGATISIWQAKSHTGSQIKMVPGTFCWGELSTNEVKKACDFYEAVFGWKFVAGEHDEYLHLQNGKEMMGGVPPASLRDPNMPPYWMSYIFTADCDASTSRAKELGAAVMLGPMVMEKVGTFSILRDPQGAMFALFQEAPKA